MNMSTDRHFHWKGLGRKALLVLVTAGIAGASACKGHNNFYCPNMAIATGLIGQTAFGNGNPNSPSISAATLNSPIGGLASNGSTITYLADTSNNRILGFQTIPSPTALGTPANFEIGQTTGTDSNNGLDFTDNSPATGTNALSGPQNVAITTFDDAGNVNGLNHPMLIVADTNNNRVLVWYELPTTNVQADLVIGQQGYTAGDPNQNAQAPSATTLSSPTSATVANDKLIVVDQNNNRILIWNQFKEAVVAKAKAAGAGAFNTTPADVELGQTTLQTTTTISTNGNPVSTTTFCGGSAAAAPANFCFTSSAPGIDQFIAGSTNNFILEVNQPTGLWTDGFRLFVSDTSNNRVLIWNQIPTVNNQLPAFVVGQTAFAQNTASAGNQHMTAPTGVFSDGANLYVADSGNNRVLEFTGIPILQNGPVATGLFGQSDFSHTAYNDDDQNGQPGDQLAQNFPTLTPHPNTLFQPTGVYADLLTSQLYVSDRDNHRIMIFPESSVKNGTLPNNCDGINAQFGG